MASTGGAKVSHNAISSPLPASIPKRKPVPGTSTTTTAPNATAAAADTPHADEKRRVLEWESIRTGKNSRFALPFAFRGFGFSSGLGSKLPFANDKRKKRLFTGGIIAAAVIIIALIIGLAVGLTVGKKHALNLPLPTSHGGPYSGDLTYYSPALGACGIESNDSDSICAVSHILFDAAQTGSDPNANPLCGLKLRLRRNAKSVDVTVVDRCVGCKVTDIDTTTSVFSQLAEIDQGRVTAEWAWLEDTPVSDT